MDQLLAMVFRDFFFFWGGGAVFPFRPCDSTHPGSPVSFLGADRTSWPPLPYRIGVPMGPKNRGS